MSEIRPSQFERVLVVAPHTDDEFGCAGAMARFQADGTEVRYLALSACEESVLSHYDRDVLRQECEAVCKQLKVSQFEIMRHRVRYFHESRQEILEKLYSMRGWPDLVLCPNSEDQHQDHSIVHQECVRAFRCSVLGYELPQNLRTFRNCAWIRLDSWALGLKMGALARYRSQGHRPYSDPTFIKSLARVRGLQAGCDYAEAYEVIRWIL